MPTFSLLRPANQADDIVNALAYLERSYCSQLDSPVDPAFYRRAAGTIYHVASDTRGVAVECRRVYDDYPRELLLRVADSLRTSSDEITDVAANLLALADMVESGDFDPGFARLDADRLIHRLNETGGSISLSAATLRDLYSLETRPAVR